MKSGSRWLFIGRLAGPMFAAALVCIAGWFAVALAFASGEFNVAFGLAALLAPVSWWIGVRIAPLLNATIERALRVADPVLFLRPFIRESGLTQPVLKSPGWLALIGPAGRVWYNFILSRTFAEDFEEHLMRHLQCVVTLGNPRNLTPRTGAYRVYVDDDRWQSTVTLFVERARAVILLSGNSPALLQELELLKSLGRAGSVFLIVDEGPDSDDWSVVKRMYEAAGWKLPSEFPGSGALLGFDDTGTGWVVEYGPLQAPAAARRIAGILNARRTAATQVPVSTPAPPQAEAPGTPTEVVQELRESAPAVRHSRESEIKSSLFEEVIPSAYFLQWVVKSLERFPIVGARMAMIYASVSLAFVTSMIVRPFVPTVPLVFVIAAMWLTIASVTVTGVWLMRRGRVRRYKQAARDVGVSLDDEESAASIIESAQCIVGTQHGKNLWEAITLRCNSGAFIELAEERVVGARYRQGARILEREVVDVDGDRYHVLTVGLADHARYRVIFDIGNREEKGLEGSPEMRVLAQKYARNLRVMQMCTPGDRVLRRLIAMAFAIVAHMSVYAAFIGACMFVANRSSMSVSAAALFCLPAPLALLLGRPFRRYAALRPI